MPYRIGIGYDIHRLAARRKLFLGGIEIPSSKGLIGHSDADVLLHAICDALLGACKLGDIGIHFPDTKSQFKNISSTKLLRRTYDIINIDTVIICDKPKLAKYTEEMKKVISEALRIPPGVINIKAKTSEGTAVDVISSYAVALVQIR